jgi:hypothetical protein
MESLRSRFPSRPRDETSIERRADVPYEDFRREYMNGRQPVILTDAISSWKSLSRWTPELIPI